MKQHHYLTSHRRKPTTTTTTTFTAAVPQLRKLKLVCSFNGEFKLTNATKKLRYVGGETRIISVDQNIGFSKLKSRIADLRPKCRDFSLWYHLLDSGPLVTIDSDVALRHMMEGYERLEFYGKRSRILVFVCGESGGGNCGLLSNCGESGKGGSFIEFYGVNSVTHFLKGPVFYGGDGDKSRKQVSDSQTSGGGDSLMKMLLKQQIASYDNLNLEPQHKPSVVNLGEEMRKVSTSGRRTMDGHQHLALPHSYPLHPRDGNSHGGVTPLTSWNSGALVVGGISSCMSSCGNGKCDLVNIGQGAVSVLNRENIIPLGYGSLSYTAKSTGLGGIQCHQFIASDDRSQQSYSYQTRDSM